MITTTHRHRVKTSEGPYGFDGCVAPDRCNPVAHGGVRYREICRCGAYRRRNSTGGIQGREEVGRWIEQSP